MRRAEAGPGSPLRLVASKRLDRMIMQAFLLVMAAWWLFPLYAAVRGAVQVGGFGNFAQLLKHPVNGVWLPRTFLSSAVIAALHAGLVCGTSACAGFAFSRLRFRGREAYYTLVLICLAVPAIAIIVPVYYITGTLGLFNSPFAVALPEATLTVPFGVLLIRNYSDGLVESVFEAAEIDRAGSWRIFYRIYLPQIRTPLINLAILSCMWSFQDFLFPSLLIQNPADQTASQAVQTIKSGFGATPLQTSQYYAALVLLGIPAVVLVILGIRWISGGLTAGAVKE